MLSTKSKNGERDFAISLAGSVPRLLLGSATGSPLAKRPEAYAWGAPISWVQANGSNGRGSIMKASHAAN